MKAIIFFSNNWEWSGGFQQYLIWNGVDQQQMADDKTDLGRTARHRRKILFVQGMQIEGYDRQIEFVLSRTSKILRQKIHRRSDDHGMGRSPTNHAQCGPRRTTITQGCIAATTAVYQSLSTRTISSPSATKAGSAPRASSSIETGPRRPKYRLSDDPHLAEELGLVSRTVRWQKITRRWTKKRERYIDDNVAVAVNTGQTFGHRGIRTAA